MNILVTGATGATGRLLVEELLSRGQSVTAIVRSPEKLPAPVRSHHGLTILKTTVLDLGEEELEQQVKNFDAFASCLGHTLNFRGMYGKPRRLVRDTTARICEAVMDNKPGGPARFVLMNTAGNRNRDLNEKVSPGQKLIIALLRVLLPPHADNEQAADYLRSSVGQHHPDIEWVVVRPDSLIDEDRASVFEVHPSPTTSALFKPGKTSRLNVARFMADLLTDDSSWEKWKGQMPVIYNLNPSK